MVDVILNPIGNNPTNPLIPSPISWSNPKVARASSITITKLQVGISRDPAQLGAHMANQEHRQQTKWLSSSPSFGHHIPNYEDITWEGTSTRTSSPMHPSYASLICVPMPSSIALPSNEFLLDWIPSNQIPHPFWPSPKSAKQNVNPRLQPIACLAN